MKRLHVHVSVDDIDASVRFYSTLFAARPTVAKDDYAKWLLDDPRVNFAISRRGATTGIRHLGIQVEDRADSGRRPTRRVPRAPPGRARAGPPGGRRGDQRRHAQTQPAQRPDTSPHSGTSRLEAKP